MSKLNKEKCKVNSIVSRFFTDMAMKHNVKVTSLNLHVDGESLHVQEYIPGYSNEYESLEIIPYE